jgi:hypothetical protein
MTEVREEPDPTIYAEWVERSVTHQHPSLFSLLSPKNPDFANGLAHVCFASDSFFWVTKRAKANAQSFSQTKGSGGEEWWPGTKKSNPTKHLLLVPDVFVSLEFVTFFVSSAR